MKKSKSVILISILQITAIGLFVYSMYTYFSIEFDARDNYWPYGRYYLTMYKHEIMFMVLSLIYLIGTVFLKNALDQVGGRTLLIAEKYIITLSIVLALISALSGMHTLKTTNDFVSLIPISFFIIVLCFALVVLNMFVLIREIRIKKKMKSETL